MYTYATHIEPFSKQFELVKIPPQKRAQIEALAQAIVQQKKKEQHHKIDHKSAFKRFYTGLLGEVALELFLGAEGIVDWTVGDSKAYHQPDLKGLGLGVGVKTVEYGLFPIIFKQNYYPQIINIAWKKEYVYICGVATVEVLNQYQSTTLIKDEYLKKRGTKTAFYGFEQLQSFQSADELQKLINEK